MYNENQLVPVKWNNTNREWYESKGYIYTKRYDVVMVAAKDLSPKSDARIDAVCDYCGTEYQTIFATLNKGRRVVQKDSCMYCTGKKTSEVSFVRRATKKINAARLACEKRGYQLLTTIDEYKDSKSPFCFVCPNHGKQYMIADNIIQGRECLCCSYEKRADGLRRDQESVRITIENKNGNKWINYGGYTQATDRNLRIQCACGREYVTSYANYTRANVTSCYSCSCKESSGEQLIRAYLEQHNVHFEQEKRFQDCRDQKPLPFDFYLPDYNLIIEFDGVQHFKDVEHMDHQTTVRHDKTKNQYCLDHGIDILRIPYWDGNRIDEIINQKLNL